MTSQPGTSRRDLLCAAAATPLFVSHADAADCPPRPTASAWSRPRSGQAAADQRAYLAFRPVLASRTSTSTRSRSISTPARSDYFRKYVRNPKYNFDQLPFPDTRITHYYDADPKAIGPFTEAFPGVKAATSPKEWSSKSMPSGSVTPPATAKTISIWSRPALERACRRSATSRSAAAWRGRRRSSSSRGSTKRRSCRRACSGITVGHGGRAAHARQRRVRPDRDTSSPACRAATAPEAGSSTASIRSGRSMTLMGAGVEAVSMYARAGRLPRPGHLRGSHARPKSGTAGRTRLASTTTPPCTSRRSATSTRRRSKGISGTATTTRCSAWPRHSVRWCGRGKEPIPHQEILEVTAIVHAAAKSLKEKSRLVDVKEVSLARRPAHHHLPALMCAIFHIRFHLRHVISSSTSHFHLPAGPHFGFSPPR